MYNEVANTYTLASNVPQVISMDESMPAIGTTLGTNSITINTAGIYQLNFFAVLQALGASSIDFHIGIQVNNTFNSTVFTSLILTSDFELISMNGIVELAAGDVLTLAMSSLVGGGVLMGPGTNASFSATLLSPL